MRFDWDEEKNLANQAKHGISFEEVLPLFSQSYEISYDREHSTADEERWIAHGYLDHLGSVMVVFVEILENEIRIISARKE